MTLKILIALMSAFREAQADESVMISSGPYSPECVEGRFCELRHDGTDLAKILTAYRWNDGDRKMRPKTLLIRS
jgi:hypothetical protein